MDTQAIRSFLQYNLSGTALNGFFVFRRVKNVSFPVNSQPVYLKYELPDEEPKIVSRTSLSREELDKSVKIVCPSFRGLTDYKSVRDEPDNIRGKSISFSSDTYCKFDVTGLTFDLFKSKPVTPIVGDLLCLFFSFAESVNAKIPTARGWFITSDQHLRAYTAIMYDHHDALTSLIAKNTSREDFNAKLKEKLFCGNRLMTNSWLKMKLAHEQNRVSLSREESVKAYWHLRTDDTSKYWVDVWAALVSLGRYGEIPSRFNVPNTKGNELQRKRWHIPVNFVEDLLSLCGIDIVEVHCELAEEEIRKYPEEFGLSSDQRDTKPNDEVSYTTISVNELFGQTENTTKLVIDIKDLFQSAEHKCADDKPMKSEKPKKNAIVEIMFSINWGEAEDGEEEKYSCKK
jgi:hypothetical protein